MTSTDETTVVVRASVSAPDFAQRRFRSRLRRLRPVLYAALALVLVLTGVWFLYFSSALSVRGVEVTGNSAVSTKRIERVAKVPLGSALVRADLAAVQARVEAIAAVRSATVSRAWPHDVRIAVTERVPVAVVARGTGTTELQAVDETGALFGKYATKPDDLPLVRTPLDVTAAALAESAKVVTALRSDIAARVRDVAVETVDRIVLHLSGGTTVMWGSAADSDEKAEVLAVLLKEKFSQIDVSVPGRPTGR